MLLIGIVSYLPNDEKLRAKRLNARNKQRDFLKQLFPNKEQIVVCQNYKEDELDKNDTNLIFDKGIGPGAARNVLLEYFYYQCINHSEYTHILILDDDISIYDYYNAFEFLHDLDSNPKKYKDLDVILGDTPQFLAFKEDMYKDGYNKTHFKFTKQSPYWTSELSIFSSKLLDTHELFDESMPNGEDADFHIRLMKAGYKVYVAEFLQMKLLLNSNGESSAIFVKGNKSRTNEEMQRKFDLAKKYGIKIQGSRVLFKKALDEWGVKYPTPLYLPRVTKYEFPKNLIPKQEKTNKLF